MKGGDRTRQVAAFNAALVKSGLTVEEVARKMRVTPATVKRYRRDGTNVHTAWRLCRLIGVDMINFCRPTESTLSVRLRNQRTRSA